MHPEDPETIHARRTSIRRALLVGIACGLGCLASGKPPADSAIDGLSAALGGIVVWTVYHLISGRPDRLALTAMNTLPIWRDPRDPWLPTMVITTLAMGCVGMVMGVVNRPPPIPGPPVPDRPLWDVHLDGPA